MTWTIAEVAREYGLTEDQLRYFDRLGILVPDRVGAIRVYDDDDLKKLQYILRLMNDGYRPSEIRTMLLAASFVEERSVSPTRALQVLANKSRRGDEIREEFGLNAYNTVYQRVSRALKNAGKKGIIKTSEDKKALVVKVLE